jgi:Fur family ferric uptake transcriptional regulator
MQYVPSESCSKSCRDTGGCKITLRNYLEKEGGRLTDERAVLLKVSCELHTHFTTDLIQRKLAERGSPMAMTTIYRNLPALEKAGIIRRTTICEEGVNKAATYEHIWGRPHHDHLLCQDCGKKIEFNYDALEVLQNEVARQYGFRLLSHHLELVGLCPECTQRADAQSGGEKSQ